MVSVCQRGLDVLAPLMSPFGERRQRRLRRLAMILSVEAPLKSSPHVVVDDDVLSITTNYGVYTMYVSGANHLRIVCMLIINKIKIISQRDSSMYKCVYVWMRQHGDDDWLANKSERARWSKI